MTTTSRRARRNRPAPTSLLDIERGSGPFLATGVHPGHEIRSSLLPLFAISEAERLREEDPFTGRLASVCPNRLVARRSRFEVDFNRPPTEAVYVRPEHAWGLNVWHRVPDDESWAKSMREYRAYYATLMQMLEELERGYGKFVVLDFHSYNHRRDGANAPPAPPALNPEVNVGTGSMDRSRWGHLVDRFMRDLREFEFMGRHLDVRENVRFKGGQVCRWVHEHFPVTGCALAIEFKKFFMDEWTGSVDALMLESLCEAVRATLPGLKQSLEQETRLSSRAGGA